MNIKGLSPDTTGCWLASGQHKSCTKIDSEFEHNAISHTTFVGRLTMLAGPTIHV